MTESLLSQLADGSYQATVLVRNNGTATAPNVQLTTAMLGSATGTPLPAVLGDIEAGSLGVAVINFPASAGVGGSATTERFTGTYTGGSFSAAIRATVPGGK